MSCEQIQELKCFDPSMAEKSCLNQEHLKPPSLDTQSNPANEVNTICFNFLLENGELYSTSFGLSTPYIDGAGFMHLKYDNSGNFWSHEFENDMREMLLRDDIGPREVIIHMDALRALNTANKVIKARLWVRKCHLRDFDGFGRQLWVPMLQLRQCMWTRDGELLRLLSTGIRDATSLQHLTFGVREAVSIVIETCKELLKRQMSVGMAMIAEV